MVEGMRVTVLGASGRTGRALVSQALEAGYEVVAFARDRSKLGIEHERLTVIEGDATDVASLERSVAGADAVLSGLGPVKGGDPRFMPRAALESSDAAYRTIVASGLDWTVARVPRLKDGPREHDLREVEAPPGPVAASRADVAAWMLTAAGDKSTVHRSPFLVV